MSNLHRLLVQPDTGIECESGMNNDFIYTAASMQGWRKNQEDRYICELDFYDDCSLFGVFDGHGGVEVAEYLKRNLHLEIRNFIEEHQDVEEALHSGFLTCDSNMKEPEDIEELKNISEEYRDADEEEESSSTDSEEEMKEVAFACGSTATVVMIQNGTIYVANVGDSRCVLSRDGRAIDLSVDHRPDDPLERARITAAGGNVADGRINNSLNLSRGFGDFRFKSNSADPSEQCITAEPYVKRIGIDKADDFIVIASDGIWNSMSSQEVVDFLGARLENEDCDLEEICEEICHLNLALQRNNEGIGCDNMTIIIVRF